MNTIVIGMMVTYFTPTITITLLTSSFCVASNRGTAMELFVKRKIGFVDCPPGATSVFSKNLP